MTFSMGYGQWWDPNVVAGGADGGTDPNVTGWDGELVVTTVVMSGTPEALSTILPGMTDVDQLGGGVFDQGRTALWSAVYEGRPEMARLLVEAGADPWREMMSGWSPGRLALAGPTPDLFGSPPAGVGLSDPERDCVARAQPVIHGFGASLTAVGWSIAAVAGVTAAEAVERVGGLPEEQSEAMTFEDLVEASMAQYQQDDVLGASDVPGGCLVVHPMGYDAATPRMLRRLSQVTSAYGVFDNMANGRQGTHAVDGVFEGWDLCPGGWPDADDDSRKVLLSYLAHQCSADGRAVVEACLVAGIHPGSPQAFYGPYDVAFRIDRRINWFGD
jgi:hypothetical protein